MARKKSRPEATCSSSETAVVAHPPTPEIQGTDASASPEPRALVNKHERSWLQAGAVYVSRRLGSLQVAVILLALFASVLAIGTMVESWYSDKVAKDLVYRTWWFNLLLFLLGINIFFAAAKKWPFKKHQTGFVITHIGLLALVTGGLLTGIWGVDTTMALLDSGDPEKQKDIGIPQSGHTVSDREKASLRVQLPRSGQEVRSYPIAFGSLPWKSDEYLKPQLHPLLAVLDFVDHPWARSWNADLDNGGWVEIVNYYPHTRKEPFKAAKPGEAAIGPAVKVSLTATAMAMKLNPDHWVAEGDRHWISPIGGLAAVEILGTCPDALLDEFQHPPANVGEKGQLVLRVGGAARRFDVAALVAKDAVAVGDTGWKLRVISYASGSEKDDTKPVNPRVDYELTSPQGTSAEFRVRGWLPGAATALDGAKGAVDARAFAPVKVWYDGPDPRFGQEYKSVLQLIVSDAGTLYYRSFSSALHGKFAFDKEGELKRNEEFPIWSQAVGWKLRLAEFLPSAVAEPGIIPEDRRAGLEDTEMKIRPAIRCVLHVGTEATEFWLQKTDDAMTRVSLGGRDYSFGFNESKMDLGFDVKLVRAETVLDPGSSSKAMYTSWVTVTDKKKTSNADPKATPPPEDFMITMNEPLHYGGYKFFQSGLDSQGFNEFNLKPINYSVFTVSSDPGLWLKHVGWVMLVIGIVCMFYMKAYFFKSSGSRAAA